MHKSVEKISIKYEAEHRKYNYVTPTSYLELLSMFRMSLKEKKTENTNAITRLKTGLDRLIDANIQVDEMKI